MKLKNQNGMHEEMKQLMKVRECQLPVGPEPFAFIFAI
jgi:hypothetical protein